MVDVQTLNMCIPVVSAIVERTTAQGREVSLQTRYKPDRDPVYSGTLEIPAGWIDRYEHVHAALKREVHEETGFEVIRIHPEWSSRVRTDKKDEVLTFTPFCCQQQLSNGLPWVGFVFICEVFAATPIAQKDECKDIHWVTLARLSQMLKENLNHFFTLQIGALQYYLKHRGM